MDSHGDCLYRYALLRVRVPELAAELVQETFLEALRGWHAAPKLARLAVALAMCLGPARAGGDHGKGAVYMMTNQAAGNQLAVFARDKQGLLEFPVFYPTGGNGTGGGLGSQGAIAMDGAGDKV